MRLKLSLKQKHIDRGVYFSHNKCPIALVIREAFPGSVVYVMPDHCWLNCGKSIHFPRSVRRFITKFDIWGRVHCKPFNFVIHVRKPKSRIKS